MGSFFYVGDLAQQKFYSMEQMEFNALLLQSMKFAVSPKNITHLIYIYLAIESREAWFFNGNWTTITKMPVSFLIGKHGL